MGNFGQAENNLENAAVKKHRAKKSIYSLKYSSAHYVCSDRKPQVLMVYLDTFNTGAILVRKDHKGGFA